ncbi:DUF2911 domain-containing protein [Adhaeribacter pallidiroseus]|uniref:DUF2911 domain-containing protein n=1 Tax=Adhaeribacter pallidiroseus TaxID=2072847 RepID=A0A369QEV4_9BACT|nr:DUF2911 domain-containing protein [Adhaeribacter pallidiroseus]RDC61439.1 hypothetical protein AHMF7616_00018 [Adhaeribacter pallidiroseus]
MKNLITGCVSVMLACLLSTSAAFAQLETPQASPLGTVSQRVGLTTISVEYSRPSAKGRKIFGGILPFGKAWRTGANGTTKITFKDDVTVQGNKVPAGEYALYTIPNEAEWTIVLNKNLTLGGNTNEYKTTEDVTRFTVKPIRLTNRTETFTINFSDLTPATANVEILWENTSVKFKVVTEVESKVMKQIQEQVINGQNVSADMYAAAASYYYENNKDNKLALEWIKKANEKDPKFWNMHTQAKIQARAKDFKGATAAAQKSIELAKAAKNDDYVRMNEQVMAEWAKAK